MAITELNLTPIYRLLVAEESRQIIPISEDDVSYLLSDAAKLYVRVGHGDNLEDAFRHLKSEMMPVQNNEKVILLVRCSESYCLSIAELAQISSFVDAHLPSADVRWGVVKTENADRNITVICAATC